MILYSQDTWVINTHTYFSLAPSVAHTVYRPSLRRLRQLEGCYGVRIEWNEAVKCPGTFHHAGTGETFGQLGLLLCYLGRRNEEEMYFLGKVILTVLIEGGGGQNLAIYRPLEAGSLNDPLNGTADTVTCVFSMRSGKEIPLTLDSEIPCMMGNI